MDQQVFDLMIAGHIVSEVGRHLGLTNREVWRAYEREYARRHSNDVSTERRSITSVRGGLGVDSSVGQSITKGFAMLMDDDPEHMDQTEAGYLGFRPDDTRDPL